MEFCRLQNSSKKHIFLKRPQISKCRPNGTQVPHFGRFGLPFNSILALCWSIRLHFDAVKPTLRPTTPKNSCLFICFDSFRFWIVFWWISADVWIDLGIVFQPNLYHISPFVFFSLTRIMEPHKPTIRQIHKHKNPARRNARRAFRRPPVGRAGRARSTSFGILGLILKSNLFQIKYGGF